MKPIEPEYTPEEDEAWNEFEKQVEELKRTNPEKPNEWLKEKLSND